MAFGDPIQFDPHYQSYHRVDDINTRSRSLVEAIIRCPRLMAGDDMACNEDRMQDTCEMPNAGSTKMQSLVQRTRSDEHGIPGLYMDMNTKHIY